MVKKLLIISLVASFLFSSIAFAFAIENVSTIDNKKSLNRLEVKHKLFNDSNSRNIYSSFLSDQKTIDIISKTTPSASLESVTENTYKEVKGQFNIKDIVKNQKSLVMVKTYDNKHNLFGLGSGFIVSADGKIVTNYHVIESAKDYSISEYDVLSGLSKIEVLTSDGKTRPVKNILECDKNLDIAILQIDNSDNLPFVKFADSSAVEVGDFVVAIGCPLGIQNTVSTGIISNFMDFKKFFQVNNYPEEKIESNTEFIQITAPISPGSSGGALFNMNGEVLGVTAASMVWGQNLNFAIPSNKIKPILDSTSNAAPNSINFNKIKTYLNNSCSTFVNSNTKINVKSIGVSPNYLNNKSVAVEVYVNEAFDEGALLSTLDSNSDIRASLKSYINLINAKVEQFYPDKIILTKFNYDGKIQNINPDLFMKYGVDIENSAPESCCFWWFDSNTNYKTNFSIVYSSYKDGITDFKWWNDCCWFWWWW